METLLGALIVALRAIMNERLSLVASVLQQLLPLLLDPFDLLSPLLFFFCFFSYWVLITAVVVRKDGRGT